VSAKSASVEADLLTDGERFMALALVLGRRGLGRTWPNPAVGAVIVKNRVIVGRGWTQPGGRPHAEV
jgi:diaminohydroxyphosphoribosylaminopyrimidine deaminase/5-amino-6-(5-phosphoribosylamino)uracil reductase